MTTKDYTKILRQHGIRPSVQRLAVYDYLWKNRTHPTAEEIFTALSPSIATLSRTTIYNTLRLFTEKGAAQMITIEEKEMRFDVLTEIHGHFKCSSCGMVSDFELDGGSIRKHLPKNARGETFQVHVHGTCAKCAGKEN